MKLLSGIAPARTNPITANATSQTVSLYRWLLTNKQTNRYAFGTNDFLTSNPGTSATPVFFDTVATFQANSGKWPGVFGVEYHDSDWVSRYGSVGADYTRAYIQENYARGAIILMHHHAGNPVTLAMSCEGVISTPSAPLGTSSGPAQAGSCYDRTGSPLAAIKTGGAQEAQFLAYLDRLAAFIQSCTDVNGQPIPIILRLFHEVNSSPFWWCGTDRAADLILVWQKMVDYLRNTKGVTNVLFCWNVDIAGFVSQFINFWPGPTYVDIISIDIYDGSSTPNASIARFGTTQPAYDNLVALAATYNKPFILPEFGYPAAAQTQTTIWDIATGDIIVSQFPRFTLAACWRSPFGPGPSDGPSMKASLQRMADSPNALTADKLSGVFS